jgi:sortase A
VKTKAKWYKTLGPVLTGPLAALVVLLIIFVLILTPANAVTRVPLPDEVKPVAVDLLALTPQPTPVPTSTPEPTTTPSSTVEPTPTPTPTPLPPLPGIIPQRLRIPAVGINAYVEQVGLDKQNRMDVPNSIWNVAWFKLGPKPGERGNAVIDGHVDGPNTPAVFWTLRNIQVGSKIYIADDTGAEKVFEVFDIGVYPYEQAPLDRIFGASNDAQLNLITCTGTFDQTSLNYDKRFVAYARLVQAG